MTAAVLPAPLIDNDIVIFGLIAGTLGLVFWTASRPGGWQRFYNIVPPLLLCYLLPGIYNSVGLIDGANSQLYNPVASRVLLPAALVLLTLSVDLKAILRLGPKLLAMYAATSASIMLGAVLSFLAMRAIAPETMAGDTWAGMAALAGSWIGGGANMMAMKEIFDVDATTFGQFAVVDVGVGYAWMAQHERIPTLADMMVIVGIAFGAVGLAHAVAGPLSAWFGANVGWAHTVSLDQPFVWIIGLCTMAGLGLSFTRARALEGAGASTIGTLLLYFLIAAIGMQMEIGALFDKPLLFLLGVVWLGIHIVLLWLVGRLLNVPFFYFAIGSQSHIGGPASAPVVASAFHRSLAPVGALLGTLGYATGTVLAYFTGLMLRALAGAG